MAAAAGSALPLPLAGLRRQVSAMPVPAAQPQHVTCKLKTAYKPRRMLDCGCAIINRTCTCTRCAVQRALGADCRRAPWPTVASITAGLQDVVQFDREFSKLQIGGLRFEERPCYFLQACRKCARMLAGIRWPQGGEK